jgi:ABC-2 type transport system permease protein
VSTIGLSFHQLRYEQKSYWRNPASAVFTFVFPILFLVIFASLNQDTRIDFLGGLSYNQFYVPAILTFGVISATYTNLAMTLTIRRDSGILKRLRGTPLPTSSLLGGLLLNSIVIAAIITVLTMGVGVLFYDVTFPGHWLALIASLGIGAATFCAIGVMITAFVPNADAAPAIVNGILFPILFLSGVFYPLKPDSVLSHIANIFPIRHIVNAVFTAFDPRLPHGPTHGWAVNDLLVLAAWGVGATLVSVRRFRWEPRTG